MENAGVIEFGGGTLVGGDVTLGYRKALGL